MTTYEYARILCRSLGYSPDKRYAGSGQHAHPPTKSVGGRGRNKSANEATQEDDGSYEPESVVTRVINIYSRIGLEDT